MSNVIAVPEVIASAATDIAAIGAYLSAAHTAAAVSTRTVRPAAADQVSLGIADFFSRHADDYQARAGRAAAFQEQFVQHLSAGAGSYAAAEAANAAVLAPLAASAGSITTAVRHRGGRDIESARKRYRLVQPVARFAGGILATDDSRGNRVLGL